MKFGHLLAQSATNDPQLKEVFDFYKRLKKDLKKYVKGELAAQQQADTVGDDLAAEQQADAVSGLGADNAAVAAAAAAFADDTDSGEGEEADSGQLPGQMLCRQSEWATDTGCTRAVPGSSAEAGNSTLQRPSVFDSSTGATIAATASVADCAGARQLTVHEARAEFQERLNSNVATFRDKCKVREEHAVMKLERLQQAAQAARDTGGPPHMQEVYAQLVGLHGELLMLLHWAMLVYTALGKILKKQRKKLQGDAPVQPQDLAADPLCDINALTGMIKDADDLLRELAAVMGPPGPPALGQPEEGLVRGPSPRVVTKAATLESQANMGALAPGLAHLRNSFSGNGSLMTAGNILTQSGVAGAHEGAPHEVPERSLDCLQHPTAKRARKEDQSGLEDHARLEGPHACTLSGQPRPAVEVIAASGAARPCASIATTVAAGLPETHPGVAEVAAECPGNVRGAGAGHLGNAPEAPTAHRGTVTLSQGPTEQEGPGGDLVEGVHEGPDGDLDEGGVPVAAALLADEMVLRQYSQGNLGDRTNAAVDLWQQLVSNVSTPSTFPREKILLPTDSAKGSNAT